MIWTTEHLKNQTLTRVEPLRSFMSPKFKWRDSSKTDVTRTWRKARLLMRLNKDAYPCKYEIQLPQ